jgi:hypothetical protein
MFTITASRFTRLLSLLFALCVSAPPAAAEVTNLENYRFRYDFSKGNNTFITSETIVGNFVGSNVTATDGPNGPNSAAFVIGGSWSQFNNQNVLNSDWTLALSVRAGKTEGGVMFALGRLPKNGSKEIALCSSSDPTKLYLRELARPSSDFRTAGSYTLTGLGNVTDGYHTLVIVHKHASTYKGTLTFYWDGEPKGSYTLQTGKPFGASSSISGIQFGQLMTAASGTFDGVTYVKNIGTDGASYYDFRLYAGCFSADDARAYAALYPYNPTLRPNAYVEANGCNAINTGVKPSASVRYLADFQYLDTRGGRRLFGTGTTGAHGEDPDGQGVFADLYIDGDAASGGSFARALHGPFAAGSTWVALHVTADRFRRRFDLDGAKGTSRLYAADGTPANTDNIAIGNLPSAADAANALTTRLFATQFADNAPTSHSTARIYSFRVERDGVLEAFFAPDVTNNIAGLRNVVTGDFHGEEMESPARALRFYNGVGCAGDYRYTNGTLSAKVYVSALANGTVRAADSAASSSADVWLPANETMSLEAVPADNYGFDKWIGDTWALAEGCRVTDPVIRVAADCALQLRATFKRDAGYAWTGAAGDGLFSSPGNWEDLVTGLTAQEPPAPGVLLVFAAGAGGTLVNDLDNLGGGEVAFAATAGRYTITGNAFTNVTKVVNESLVEQTFSNAVAFAAAYNVNLAKPVAFAGGARAVTAGTVTGSAGGTLTGDITFTGDWVMNTAFTVPSGSRVAAQNVTGSGAALTIDKDGYVHVASIQPGKNDTVWRINLNVNGVLEVDGNVNYWNSGGGGSVQAVSSSAGTGVIIAKGFCKIGGKQHLCTIKHIKIGAGRAETAPIFGATGGSNMLHFFEDITVQAMADIEFQSVLGSGSGAKENGGICLQAGKTMTIKTEDDDGDPHTVIWGSSFCVKAKGSNGVWGYSSGNVRLSKQGKGTLILRNRCSITGKSGYVKDYHGWTDVRGGTLRVEEKGQLSASALTVYGGARFELAGNVALPNKTTLSGGDNSLDIGNGASLTLQASSGHNVSVTMGTGATLTGNISLGTNTTVTVGANAQITGSVTVGTNSTVTLGAGAQIKSHLALAAGSRLAVEMTAQSPAPVAGVITLPEGRATVKVTGDLSSEQGKLVIEKTLCKFDDSMDVDALVLDASGVTYPPNSLYHARLMRKDGDVVFRAVRKIFSIIVR